MQNIARRRCLHSLHVADDTYARGVMSQGAIVPEADRVVSRAAETGWRVNAIANIIKLKLPRLTGPYTIEDNALQQEAEETATAGVGWYAPNVQDGTLSVAQAEM